MSLFVFSIILGFLIHQFLSRTQIKDAAATTPAAGEDKRPSLAEAEKTRRIRFGTRFVLITSLSGYKLLVFVIWGLIFILVALAVAGAVHPPAGYALRFIDVFTSPKIAAVFFGSFIGFFAAHLATRILYRPRDSAFTARDKLYVLLLAGAFFLGIGGEELIRSGARKISKVAFGGAEISFVEVGGGGQKASRERVSNAVEDSGKTHDYLKSSGGPGLAILAALDDTIKRDDKYRMVLDEIDAPKKAEAPVPKIAAMDAWDATEVAAPKKAAEVDAPKIAELAAPETTEVDYSKKGNRKKVDPYLATAALAPFGACLASYQIHTGEPRLMGEKPDLGRHFQHMIVPDANFKAHLESVAEKLAIHAENLGRDVYETTLVSAIKPLPGKTDAGAEATESQKPKERSASVVDLIRACSPLFMLRCDEEDAARGAIDKAVKAKKGWEIDTKLDPKDPKFPKPWIDDDKNSVKVHTCKEHGQKALYVHFKDSFEKRRLQELADTPYLVITYASILAARENYQAAAEALHDWLRFSDKTTTVRRPTWHIIRARYTLASVIEAWTRHENDNPALALREYHINNLDTISGAYENIGNGIVSVMLAETGSVALETNSAPIPWPSDRETCRWPRITSKENGATFQDEEGQYAEGERFFESYLSINMKYVDQALRHPTYKKRSASRISARMSDLMRTGLSCASPDKRNAIRAEILGLHALNELNRAEIAATVGDAASLKTRLQEADQVARLALEIINRERAEAAAVKRLPDTPFLQKVISTTVDEIYESLLETREKTERALREASQ